MSPESARPGTAGDVDAGLPPLLARLRAVRVALGEGLEDAEHVRASSSLRAAEFAHREMQRRGERPAQRLVGTGLELAGAPAAADRGRAHRVQQHRLAHPAQPGQHDRALRPRPGDPLEHDVEGVAARRRGRRVRAGAARRRGRTGCGPDPRSDCIGLSSEYRRFRDTAILSSVSHCRDQRAVVGAGDLDDVDLAGDRAAGEHVVDRDQWQDRAVGRPRRGEPGAGLVTRRRRRRAARIVRNWAASGVALKSPPMSTAYPARSCSTLRVVGACRDCHLRNCGAGAGHRRATSPPSPRRCRPGSAAR